MTDWQGKSVLVAGLGPAGLAAGANGQSPRCAGGLGSDLRLARLKLAEQLGVDRAVDAGYPQTHKLLVNQGFDRVYETTGNSTSIRQSLQCAREGVILFGYSEGELCLDAYPIFDRELTRWAPSGSRSTICAPSPPGWNPAKFAPHP
jgi:threonine dehydrogenase-like Zn-dependent dehydrogenase